MSNISAFACVATMFGLALAATESLPLTAQTLLDEGSMDTDIRPTDVIHWTPVSAESTDGVNVKAAIRLATEKDFSIYSTKVTFKGPDGFAFVSVNAGSSETIVDPIEKKDVQVFRAGDFEIQFKGAEPVQGDTFTISVTFIGCTTRICLFPFTQEIQLPYFIKRADTQIGQMSNTDVESAEDFEAVWAKKVRSEELPIYILLAIVFIGGMLTNLTPCVYPMFPITLRILSKQGGSAFLASSAYAGGILLTYTMLGTFAALSGGMFGSALANPYFNIAFAIVMGLFGITMLGFGNLSKLQNFGSRLGTGPSSARNAFLMGTGAGLIAAPCTGPILAALLTYTAESQDVAKGTFLLFVYSAGFALPYVFLGKAASKVSKMKVPPAVQVGVKIAFASVMFTLTLYYLRIPAYKWLAQMSGQWKGLATVGIPLGLIMLAAWATNSKLSNNKSSMLLPSIILGVALFAGYQWRHGDDAKTSLVWYTSEAEGFTAAKSNGLPIFIDNWAEWCESCKEMEATVFKDPEVIAEFSKNWTLVKLDLTESNDFNDGIIARYNIPSLPTFILLPKDGSVENKQVIAGKVSTQGLLDYLRGSSLRGSH